MRNGGWQRQIALAEVLDSGTQVLARDSMEIPLLALRPELGFVCMDAAVRLEPAEGGVIVHCGEWPAAREARQRLAIAESMAAAAALGRRAWERAAFLASDGQRLEGVGMPVPGRMRRALRGGGMVAGPSEPAALLRRVGQIGRTSLLETGDGVLWIDPLHCLRGLTSRRARQIAWRGVAGAAGAAPLHLAVPSGRVRILFDRVAARPDIEGPAGTRVAWIGDDTADIDTGAGVLRAVILTVRLHRARLSRVGLVIPIVDDVQETDRSDPLDAYGDPIGLDPLA